MKKTAILNLTDLFNIKPSEWKLVLNIRAGSEGEKYADKWNSGRLGLGDVGFSYWSHSSEKGNGRRNFNVGDKVLGFMRIGTDRYLLITAGRVTEVPDHAGPCGYEPLHEFDAYLGRLIIITKKGNAFARYVFRLDKYLATHTVEVAEILRAEMRPIEFTDYENVHLTFPVLKQILESEKYADYRKMLASVKGVYCLTDRLTGKLYIGSAYGADGVAQRWRCYLDTWTGGNVKLVELYNRETEAYFDANFTFTLLEFFDKKTAETKILERENYWKEALDTRNHGYNDN